MDTHVGARRQAACRLPCCQLQSRWHTATLTCCSTGAVVMSCTACPVRIVMPPSRCLSFPWPGRRAPSLFNRLSLCAEQPRRHRPMSLAGILDCSPPPPSWQCVWLEVEQDRNGAPLTCLPGATPPSSLQSLVEGDDAGRACTSTWRGAGSTRHGLGEEREAVDPDRRVVGQRELGAHLPGHGRLGERGRPEVGHHEHPDQHQQRDDQASHRTSELAARRVGRVGPHDGRAAARPALSPGPGEPLGRPATAQAAIRPASAASVPVSPCPVPGSVHSSRVPARGGGQGLRVRRGEVRIGGEVHQQQRRGRDRPGHLHRRRRHHGPRPVQPHAEQPGHGAAVRLLQHPVHPAHRRALPGVPAGRAAHRHHRVRPVLAQRGLPQRDRGAQREPDGGHPGVPGGARPGHRGVDVEQLPVAHRVPATGTAVPAQVEGDARPRARPARRSPVWWPSSRCGG